MINREKLMKWFDAVDALEELGLKARFHIEDTWWFLVHCPAGMEDLERRKVIAIVTPLVGKMELRGDDWAGSTDKERAILYGANACKILGYKTVKKTVKKEIKRRIEYEEVEEEVSVPITDCDIKSGAATQEEIEVPA